VNCSFLFVLFVFVLCLVPNVICACELFILVCFVCHCSVPCTQCYLRLWIVHSCLALSVYSKVYFELIKYALIFPSFFVVVRVVFCWPLFVFWYYFVFDHCIV
jgi:hypothetical protein